MKEIKNLLPGRKKYHKNVHSEIWVIRFLGYTFFAFILFFCSVPASCHVFLSELYVFLGYTFFSVPAAFSSGLYVFYSKKFLIRRYDFPKGAKPREGKGREYLWLARARSKRLFWYCLVRFWTRRPSNVDLRIFLM